MWSTKDRPSLTHVPSLPAIDAGHHSNNPISPTPHKGSSLEERMGTLELSNKALLEEMMHVHATLRRERELSSKSLSEAMHETNQRLSHTQAHWQRSSDELMSQSRRMADRLARLERILSSMEGMVAQIEGEREKQDVVFKNNFSDLHEHMSWLTKKMEGTVSELNSTLKGVQDSTATRHTQLVSTVSTAIESRQGPLEERVCQLEKALVEDQESSKDLELSIARLKDDLNALTEALDVDQQKSRSQMDSLRESVTCLAKEGSTNHQELSTVLKAEIKTRQKVFNDVRGQCIQVQELCRGSVQALREGVLSLEERMAAVRKELHTGHEQQTIHCQEMGNRLQVDLDARMASLHQYLAAREPPRIKPSGAFLPTIEEVPNKEDQQNEVPVTHTTLHSQDVQVSGVTVEQSKQLLDQSKVLLDQSKELQSGRDQSKQVLQQLQTNLSQSEQLLNQSKQVQSNLEQSKQVLHQVHTQSNLNESKQALEEAQSILKQSRHVLVTLNESTIVLNQLKAQLDQTKQASNQVQENLDHSTDVLDQLQSNLDQSRYVLDRVHSELGQLQAESNSEQDSSPTAIGPEYGFTQSKETPSAMVDEDSKSINEEQNNDQSDSESNDKLVQPEDGKPLKRTTSYLEPMIVPEQEDMIIPIALLQRSRTIATFPVIAQSGTASDEESESIDKEPSIENVATQEGSEHNSDPDLHAESESVNREPPKNSVQSDEQGNSSDHDPNGASDIESDIGGSRHDLELVDQGES